MLFASPYWPLLILAVCIAFIIFGISKLRMHPFIALILAALLAGTMARQLTDKGVPLAKPWGQTDVVNDAAGKPLKNHLFQVVELTAKGFGDTCGSIAISIALASIIGLCLMESGGADKVVRCFLRLFGLRFAGVALLVSTYILSVPIFFDTMFMLMVPLAKALRMRTGKDYLLYVLCICCGGVITHSMTVPHPGPLGIVENFKGRVDVGLSILVGFMMGTIPAAVGYFVCSWLNRHVEVPLRETPGTDLKELEGLASRDESQLPSLFMSLLPVVLPIALISLGSLFVILQPNYGTEAWFRDLGQYVEFIGHKNIALFIGALISVGILAKQRGFSLKQIESMMGTPLETAATIILITAAGGAFGFMLRSAGVGDAIKTLTAGTGINLIVLSYAIAFIIRVAQGSATVSMLTTSAMVFPMFEDLVLPYHPIYLYLSIGFGAYGGSWMNDSGFWVVSRLSGMTEKETLKTWSVVLTATSLVGFVVTFLFSKILPFA